MRSARLLVRVKTSTDSRSSSSSDSSSGVLAPGVVSWSVWVTPSAGVAGLATTAWNGSRRDMRASSRRSVASVAE